MKYTVEFILSGTYKTEVEAKNPRDAEKKAMDLFILDEYSDKVDIGIEMTYIKDETEKLVQ